MMFGCIISGFFCQCCYVDDFFIEWSEFDDGRLVRFGECVLTIRAIVLLIRFYLSNIFETV